MPATLHIRIKKDYALSAIEDLEKKDAIEFVPVQDEQLISEMHKEWLKREFEIYKEKWEEDTMFSSSTTEMINHPAYKQIIGFGKEVVPYLLKDMAKTGNHWFEALQSITGANPIQHGHRGKIQLMIADWMQWAIINKIDF